MTSKIVSLISCKNKKQLLLDIGTERISMYRAMHNNVVCCHNFIEFTDQNTLEPKYVLFFMELVDMSFAKYLKAVSVRRGA
jgi:hypothetical protein